MTDGITLEAAAQKGDIDVLYTLIQKDKFVLENTDELPFVDTPLHIAASSGHLHFADEIMRLKPSFPWKLNQQGWSPIHLALQQGHNKMVLRFVDINKDLARVKGREGVTPLHLVSIIGDIDLLAYFLKACPDSIEDLTVRRETALHIAVKNRKYDVLQVLVGWRGRNRQKDALSIENSILNGKDEEGNTILHISALNDDIQALDLLMNTNKMDLNVKNSENSTALDKAASEEIERKLLKAGAKHGASVEEDSTVADALKLKITYFEKSIIQIRRIRREISDEKRNAYLVIATLVATAIYQSALSPPGGIYQAEADSNSTTLSLIAAPTQGNTGKSVMSSTYFRLFSLSNPSAFLVSIMMISLLTPGGIIGIELMMTTLLFAASYLISMMVISPTSSTTFLLRFWAVIYGLAFLPVIAAGIATQNTLNPMEMKLLNRLNAFFIKKVFKGTTAQQP